MADKPSYAQLEKQVELLNKEARELKKVQEALRLSEDRYSLFVENFQGIAYQAIIEDSDTFRPTFFHGTVKKITGFSNSDFLSGQITWDEIIFPDDLPMVIKEGEKLVSAPGYVADNEYRITRKDGTLRWVNDICRRSPTGNIFQGTIYDITARKKAEAALKENEEKYRSFLDSAPDPIMIYAMDGTIEYVNRAFESTLGRRKKDLIGKNVDSPVYGLMEEARANLKSMLKESKTDDVIDTKCFTGEGRILNIQLRVSPYALKKGEPAGHMAVIRNVTKVKKLEAQVRQSQKMEAIGTLAGGIAHDFNNILAAIIGYSELSLDYVPEGSQLESNVKEVLRAGRRARELVKQILAFSRKSEQDKKPIQIAPVVKEALKLLRSSIPSTIEIQQKIDMNLDNVKADPTQLHQILMNLCTNANFAMRKQGGVLSVSLSAQRLDDSFSQIHPDLKPGAYLKLSIGDTGEGMSPDMLDAIFDPYFTTKEMGEGTGMGLAVVHGIVKGCGGDVVVFSEPGKGSRFDVYLPAVEDMTKLTDDIRPPVSGGNERILFVDDEAVLANIAKEGLTLLGYDVRVETSSLEALALFRTSPHRFDLVITDMTMPHMNGDDLAVKILENRKDIPIVMCTGYNNLITREKAHKIGINSFLMKPLEIKDLARTIRDTLDNPKQLN